MTLVRVLWGMMGLLIIAGFIGFSVWEIPAPSIRIEKNIPNEKLPQ